MSKCWKCRAEQPETFADLVKEWRGERTQKQAAEAVGAAGISNSTISRVEGGELPDLRSFVALVDAMQVEPAFAYSLLARQVLRAGAPIAAVETPNEAGA